MILIIDSGSTKAHFVLLDKEGTVTEFTGKGFNPYYYGQREFYHLLKDELYVKVKSAKADHIYFYGAGCSSDKNCNLVIQTLSEFFPSAEIHAEHDLYGAAIALFGHQQGIACILGTGSNSCLWDGRYIMENVPSLGYLLGDEGGGTYLGKILLTDILSGKADAEITLAFYDEYELDFSKTLEKIYREAHPNRFFSSLSLFVQKHIDNEYCRALVKRNFTDFIDKQVSQYTDYQSLPISFIGSVAFHYRGLLEEVFKEHGLTVGKVLQKPMEGLIEFHRKEE